MTPEEVIDRLVARRLEKGLTYRELAARVRSSRMSPTTKRPAQAMAHASLWEYENGTKRPTVVALESWANALGYDLDLELREREG